MKRTVRPSAQVIAFQRALPPEQRQAIKQTLIELQSELGDIRPLEGELAVFHRLRVGRFRIILRFAESGSIDALFVEARSIVYEVFATAYVRRLIDPEA